MLSVKITGMGKYLPERKVLSSELDRKLNLSEGTVQKKSGLISRHFAQDHETTSYMAAEAAREAAHQAGISLNEIDAIIGACGAGEQPIPCTAVLVQKQLGLKETGIPCFDINSTCLSFLTGLEIAAHLISNDRFKRILIVASDIPSAGLNWEDLETCSIFGDGAAACILEKSQDNSRILGAHMITCASGSTYCEIKAGGTRIPPASQYDSALGKFAMDGKKVFKLASKMLDSLHTQLLEKVSMQFAEIDWIVPHQASLLAMHHIQKRLEIPKEKFVNIYSTHGNQMAASIPSVLCHLIQSKQLQRSQKVYLLGTGAGLSAAGLIMEY